MGRGREAATELMPRLVEGYTELGSGKLKSWKGFSKPNFELGPSVLHMKYISPATGSDGLSNDGLFCLICGLTWAAISVKWAAHCVAAVVPARTNIAE